MLKRLSTKKLDQIKLNTPYVKNESTKTIKKKLNEELKSNCFKLGQPTTSSSDHASNECLNQNPNISSSNSLNKQFKNWSSNFNSINSPNKSTKSKIVPKDLTKKSSTKHIYQLYYDCKQVNLKPKIKFTYSQLNGIDPEIFVKISVAGYESKLGKGSSDIEAIENAAKGFILRSNNVDETDDETDIDYYSVLNRIHLRTKLEFKSNCLLSIENKPDSFYLYRCQLGDLIAYGMDERIDGAQNNAANEVLKKLKGDLMNDIVKLNDKVKEIQDEIHEKQNFIYLINYEVNQQFDLSSSETEDEVKCLN